MNFRKALHIDRLIPPGNDEPPLGAAQLGQLGLGFRNGVRIIHRKDIYL
jgi:hypothetical protein